MALDSQDKKVVHAHIGATPYKVEMHAGDHAQIADEPRDHGGGNTGPDPYDYLLMSLGSCTAMTVQMYAERKEWPLEEVYVELLHSKTHSDDCENCQNSQSRLDHIEKDVVVKGDLTDKQQERLLEISKRCPVHRTLQSEIKISSQISHKK